MSECWSGIAAIQMTPIAVVFGAVLLMVLLWILLARLWRIGNAVTIMEVALVKRLWNLIRFYALTTRRERAYVRMVAKDLAALEVRVVNPDGTEANESQRAAFGEQLRQMNKGATS